MLFPTSFHFARMTRYSALTSCLAMARQSLKHQDRPTCELSYSISTRAIYRQNLLECILRTAGFPLVAISINIPACLPSRRLAKLATRFAFLAGHRYLIAPSTLKTVSAVRKVRVTCITCPEFVLKGGMLVSGGKPVEF